jgi:hypothetical protein
MPISGSRSRSHIAAKRYCSLLATVASLMRWLCSVMFHSGSYNELGRRRHRSLATFAFHVWLVACSWLCLRCDHMLITRRFRRNVVWNNALECAIHGLFLGRVPLREKVFDLAFRWQMAQYRQKCQGLVSSYDNGIIILVGYARAWEWA